MSAETSGPVGDLQVLDEIEAIELGTAGGQIGQIPALGRRRPALPMRTIEQPRDARARGRSSCAGYPRARLVLAQRQADRIGSVLAQDALLAQARARAAGCAARAPQGCGSRLGQACGWRSSPGQGVCRGPALTQLSTVPTLTPKRAATSRMLAPLRTARTISRRRCSIARFYPWPPHPKCAHAIANLRHVGGPPNRTARRVRTRFAPRAGESPVALRAPCASPAHNTIASSGVQLTLELGCSVNAGTSPLTPSPACFSSCAMSVFPFFSAHWSALAPVSAFRFGSAPCARRSFTTSS